MAETARSESTSPAPPSVEQLRQEIAALEQQQAALGQQLEVQGLLSVKVLRGLSDLMLAMHHRLNQITEDVSSSIQYHAKRYSQAAPGRIRQKDPETFLPDELLAIREKRHLTQEEATRILDLPPGQWRKWELGQGKPLGFQVHLIRLIEEGSLTLEHSYR